MQKSTEARKPELRNYVLVGSRFQIQPYSSSRRWVLWNFNGTFPDLDVTQHKTPPPESQGDRNQRDEGPVWRRPLVGGAPLDLNLDDLSLLGLSSLAPCVTAD